MRIWHEKLIPHLCRQHLLAVWREGLGCWSILTNNKKGYRNHPAFKEWEDHFDILWLRLYEIREEMLKRGYNPKKLPNIRHKPVNEFCCSGFPKEWQTLDEQIEVLKQKGCDCNLSTLDKDF